MNGHSNLFLVRVLRKQVRGPMMLPGDQMLITCCEGRADAEAYIATERAQGPCQVWLAFLGDIPETRFVEFEG